MTMARWRAAVLFAMSAGALLPLALAQRAHSGYERTLAARDATAAAAYLTIVTPLARRGAGYDLPQLLIRARALEELPGSAGPARRRSRRCSIATAGTWLAPLPPELTRERGRSPPGRSVPCYSFSSQ